MHTSPPLRVHMPSLLPYCLVQAKTIARINVCSALYRLQCFIIPKSQLARLTQTHATYNQISPQTSEML